MSEMTDKFPTAAACDIVGHNRQRLNEDIAQGFYPCAPEAHHKIGRWWNEDDLCALRVYSFLLNVYGAQDDRDRAIRKPSISKRVAGIYAEGVLAALRSGVDESRRVDFPLDGFNDGWTDNDSDAPPNFTTQLGTSSEIATICFSLAGIRSQVRSLVALWSGELR